MRVAEAALIKLTGDWRRARRILRGSRDDMRRAVDRMARAEARHVARKIVEGLKTQRPGGRPIRPPSRATLLVRQLRGISSRRALVASGQLMRAIAVTRGGRGRYFVGVKRQRRGRGPRLDVIARMQEEGFGPVVIKITPKMRRFLGAVFRGRPRGTASRGVVVVRVPPRPFIRPVVEREARSLRRLARARRVFVRVTRGRFGT